MVFTLFLGAIILTALIITAIKVFNKLKTSDTLHGKVIRIQPFLIIGFLLCLSICVLFSTIFFYGSFISNPVTSNAKDVVPLFNVTFVATSIAFFVTQFGVFYFAFKYRAKPGRKATAIRQNSKLEIAWTLLPAVVFVFLFLWGQLLWARIVKEPPAGALQIDVVGQQFSWLTRYPGKDAILGRNNFRLIDNVNDVGIDVTDPASQDDFIPVQMHIPKGKPVTLLLRSKDVIHSFYVPYFGIKMDAVPGMITTMNFTATKTTEEMRRQLKDNNFDYEVACAELCGRMHFAMKLIIVVEEPAEFEKWNQRQPGWISTHTQEEFLQ